MKKRFRFKNLTFPIQKTDAARKSYVDSGLIYPSIIWNNAQIDFNDKNLDNDWLFKMDTLPAV